MKFLYIVLLLAFSSVCLSTETIIISAEQEAPFQCSNATLKVNEYLKLQCESLGMKIKFIKNFKCTKTGDDGNYVEYFTAYAEIICI